MQDVQVPERESCWGPSLARGHGLARSRLHQQVDRAEDEDELPSPNTVSMSPLVPVSDSFPSDDVNQRLTAGPPLNRFRVPADFYQVRDPR
jgi:hypothetical protein